MRTMDRLRRELWLKYTNTRPHTLQAKLEILQVSLLSIETSLLQADVPFDLFLSSGMAAGMEPEEVTEVYEESLILKSRLGDISGLFRWIDDQVKRRGRFLMCWPKLGRFLFFSIECVVQQAGDED
jgi:hypothetical protein